MVDDPPDELVYDIFSEPFWRNHPLGRPIQGTRRAVSRMNLPMLIKYFRDSYQPANFMITSPGNVEHQRLPDAIRNPYEPIPCSPYPVLILTPLHTGVESTLDCSRMR